MNTITANFLFFSFRCQQYTQSSSCPFLRQFKGQTCINCTGPTANNYQQSAVIIVNYNITDCSEEVVVGGVDPLRGPARGPGEHVARVAVVVTRVAAPPHAPHVLPQQVLVRALPRGRRRVRPPVRQHRRPAVRPPFPPKQTRKRCLEQRLQYLE